MPHLHLQGTFTDLGDLAPAAAVAAVIALWCWFCVKRLIAVAFAALFGSVLVAVTLLKLVAAEYAPPLDVAPLFSFSTGAPSGHVALATVVYGSAAVLCARAAKGTTAMLGSIFCWGVVAVVAITRVTLGHHTIGDVGAGLAVGGLGIFLLDRMLQVQRTNRLAPTSALMLGILLVGGFMLVSGVRMPSTNFI